MNNMAAMMILLGHHSQDMYSILMVSDARGGGNPRLARFISTWRIQILHINLQLHSIRFFDLGQKEITTMRQGQAGPLP